MLQGNGQIIKKRLNNHIFLITFPGYSHIPSERQIGKVIRQFPRRFLIFLLILLIQFFHLFFQRQIHINAHFFPGCTIRNPPSVQEAIMTLSSLLLPGCSAHHAEQYIHTAVSHSMPVHRTFHFVSAHIHSVLLYFPAGRNCLP